MRRRQPGQVTSGPVCCLLRFSMYAASAINAGKMPKQQTSSNGLGAIKKPIISRRTFAVRYSISWRAHPIALATANAVAAATPPTATVCQALRHGRGVVNRPLT